jgi:hypothetical protein
MIRRSFIRLTPRNKIWPRPSHSILYEIGDEEREDKAYEPAEDRDVRFMAAWLKNQGPCDEEAKGNATCVDEEPDCGVISV